MRGAGYIAEVMTGPTGSGKTLAALLFLVSGPVGEKKVIITRATTKNQWKREASQYTDLKLRVLSGTTPYELSPGDEAVVLSWEILKGWYPELVRWAGNHPMSVIWDEIHKGKSHRRKEKYVRTNGTIGWRLMENRAAYASRLSKLASRSLGLTATT